MKILIAEHVHANLMLPARLAERMGAMPLPAESGISAIEVFQRKKCGLIRLNMVSPAIDACSLILSRRARNKPGQQGVGMTSTLPGVADPQTICAMPPTALYRRRTKAAAAPAAPTPFLNRHEQ